MKTINQLIDELQAIKDAGDGEMAIRFGAEGSEDAYDIDSIVKETDPDDGEEFYCLE